MVWEWNALNVWNGMKMEMRWNEMEGWNEMNWYWNMWSEVQTTHFQKHSNHFAGTIIADILTDIYPVEHRNVSTAYNQNTHIFLFCWHNDCRHSDKHIPCRTSKCIYSVQSKHPHFSFLQTLQKILYRTIEESLFITQTFRSTHTNMRIPKTSTLFQRIYIFIWTHVKQNSIVHSYVIIESST